MKRLTSVVAAAALVAGSVSVAVAANADNLGTIPAGCSITANKPNITLVSGQSRVKYGGYYACNQVYIGFFRLVHNFNGLPDDRVKEHLSTTQPLSWTGNTCDNGPTTTPYYSEVGWSTQFIGDVQRISATATLTHC